MTDRTEPNRWWIVAGALIIQISLGAVYIWSVFQTPLRSAFPAWTETQVTLPAQIVLAVFALAVILGGRVQDRLGPRRVATAGGVLLGAGLALAGLTGRFAEAGALRWLILTFAVLGGAGIGMAYVCPIATCVKWFPDKRGLITGLAVAGFGAGAFFFAPLARGLISGTPYHLLGGDLFALPRLGLYGTFVALGVIFLVAVTAGAQLLRNPPAGYGPAGWTPPTPAPGAAARVDFGPRDMLRTRAFWLLWLTYFAGCTAGLMVIMKAAPIWKSFHLGGVTPPVNAADFVRVTTAGAMAVSVLAIFNSLGRIFWGRVSDALGRRATLVVIFLLCGGAMLALDLLRLYPRYLAGVCLIGLCFGGFLAVYPALTADFFGTRHYGVNYGWMFTAFGAGGIAGPFLAARLMRGLTTVPYAEVVGGETIEKLFETGDYRPAFLVAAIACFIAAALMGALRKPVAPAA
jgi:MFS transporter, OFA family, oxalate/formate antiporter